MNNPKAQKLIKKILDDIDHVGIITNTLVDDLKKLRPYAVEEKRPVIAKAIRLTFEHVEAYDSFYIPIPEDDPIEEEDLEEDVEIDTEIETTTSTPEESLSYLLSLIKDSDNRLNIEEIREFNAALIEYAEEN
ncbi:hypothetical protein [Haloflavibacter putidus]|uniref:Uncharacterized protein n=1 Tax=Haloflavibacter putidus TaxID=2576776 RepID=A0A508A023_9FLAO|nr:hypothetical protein [Haloflavibacter putidus]TQD40265.1 hypothetical protein FKR84_03440 [Haloflavibacter putidus]